MNFSDQLANFPSSSKSQKSVKSTKSSKAKSTKFSSVIQKQSAQNINPTTTIGQQQV